MNGKAYPYVRITVLVLMLLGFALIFPFIIEPLRYTEYRLIWFSAPFGCFILLAVVHLLSLVNAAFMLRIFYKTKHSNWYWFTLNLLPIIFFLLIFLM